MTFYRFYAANGGTKPKMAIFLGRNNLLGFILLQNKD
jgi:hypothetical protein